jgi:hypothetical protein
VAGASPDATSDRAVMARWLVLAAFAGALSRLLARSEPIHETPIARVPQSGGRPAASPD